MGRAGQGGRSGWGGWGGQGEGGAGGWWEGQAGWVGRVWRAGQPGRVGRAGWMGREGWVGRAGWVGRGVGGACRAGRTERVGQAGQGGGGGGGNETSPKRTHNNTQGNHEVRALQQPPNAAHAKRAISKHPPPPKVPTYSTRAGAAPHAPGGARHSGGNRAVTSQPRTGQSTLLYIYVYIYIYTYIYIVQRCEILVRGGRRVGQEGMRDRGT